MIRYIFLLLFLLGTSTNIFGANITFNFNTDRGVFNYENTITKDVKTKFFKDSSTTLDMAPGSYNITFKSPNFKDRFLSIKVTGDDSYDITLDRSESDFTIALIESDTEDVFFSKIFPKTIKSTSGSVFFYKGDTLAYSIELDDNPTPLHIKHDIYNVVVKKDNIDIFSISNLPVNNQSGSYLNFFLPLHRVAIKGDVKSNDLLLGGAVITFTDVDGNTYSTRSDFSGAFNLYLPPRKYTVTAEKFGFSLNDSTDLLYDFSLKGVPNNVHLEMDEAKSKIEGRIFDELGNLVTDAEVSFKVDDQIFTTTTDSYGRFKSSIPAGVVFIRVEKDGYFKRGKVENLEKFSSLTNIAITLDRKLHFLKGVVLDGVFPAKGVEVALYNKRGVKLLSTLTGENGYYEIVDIPENDVFSVRVNRYGYASSFIQLKENTKNYNIILNEEKEFITINFKKDGLPLSNTTVTINGRGYLTNGDGLVEYSDKQRPLNILYRNQGRTLKGGRRKNYTVNF